MSKQSQEKITYDFKKTQEEVDCLLWMRQIFVSMFEKDKEHLLQGWVLKARLKTLNNRLDENAEKFPALRALFNKNFIKEISEWNHAKASYNGAQKTDFASHTRDSVSTTISQMIKTINLCLFTEAFAQSDADVIIVSAGCDAVEEQRYPTYAKAFSENKKVLILNIDPMFMRYCPEDKIIKNTQILHFGAPFGYMGMPKNQLVLHTEILSQPFNEASLFCKAIIEQSLTDPKKHIILQSFFGPGLPLTPLAHHLGLHFNNKIGVQLEIIGGYDEVFPVILHSKEYFLQHKQTLERIEKSLLEMNDQSKKLASEPAKVYQEKRDLELAKEDVSAIIIKHGGYSGVKLAENYAKAKKEFSEFHYGELYPVLEKLGANELFVASPSLHQKVVVVEIAKPPMLDMKRIEETSQRCLVELEKWIKLGKIKETIDYLNGHPNMLSTQNKFGRTLAHIAVTANLNDDPTLIHYLADKKHDLNIPDNNGDCPFVFVAWNAGSKTTAALIQHDAHTKLSKEQLAQIKSNAEKVLLNSTDEQNAQRKASAALIGDLVVKIEHMRPKQ